MTRKKLGLGLLETFSEPCEVCAGRGVVVHHDPVVKHRGGPSGGQGRRSRGSSSSQSGQQASAAAQNAAQGTTHSITEGAKSALAAIAASTILPVNGDAPAVVAEGDQPTAGPERAAEPERTADAERPKKGRKKRGERKGPKSEAEQLLDSVLDALPEPKAPGQGRNRRRVTTAMLTPTSSDSVSVPATDPQA
ncbi:hypothetical protein GCM10025863_05860 [Microbacterium suwonense]|uniref:Uncharacterized protein n=2 Tax=Microbacterium suwonense TaxID=683047 RepID=A0ABM8FQL3_9MICO|nr:hypothetical protein GCM10025863_05860 [Microbacterium suwonense]